MNYAKLQRKISQHGKEPSFRGAAELHIDNDNW